MAAHQSAFFFRRGRFCPAPQFLKFYEVSIRGGHMDDQEPGRSRACIPERMKDAARDQSPKPGSTHATLSSNDEFDLSFENIKTLRSLMCMRLWSAVAYRQSAFHQAERPICSFRNRFEEHQAP